MQILKNEIPDTSSYALGLIEAEEARRIARELEQAKFNKANGKLNIPSFHQKPIANSLSTFKTVSSSEMIARVNDYIQTVHQPAFEALMQEEDRHKSGYYETYSTPPSYSSNSSSSSSSSDSSSCSDSSSSSSSSCD